MGHLPQKSCAYSSLLKWTLHSTFCIFVRRMGERELYTIDLFGPPLLYDLSILTQ